MWLRISQFARIAMYRGKEIGSAVGGLDAYQDKRHAAEDHLNGLALVFGEAIRANFSGFRSLEYAQSFRFPPGKSGKFNDV